MIFRLFRWLTGGRPMRIIRYAFDDCVLGGAIYYCRDSYGRIWMATGPWSWFRVRITSRSPFWDLFPSEARQPR